MLKGYSVLTHFVGWLGSVKMHVPYITFLKDGDSFLYCFIL